MRVSRRSFLGGSIASIGLLFGGFGWMEDPLLAALQPVDDPPITATEVVEGFPTRAQVEEMMEPSEKSWRAFAKAQAQAFDRQMVEAYQKGLERDREILEAGVG